MGDKKDRCPCGEDDMDKLNEVECEYDYTHLICDDCLERRK